MTRRSVTANSVEATSFRGRFFVLAALTFGATSWAVYDEAVTRRPWKRAQAQFEKLLAARGRERAAAGIRQVTIPALEVGDRCPTCHMGIDRPGLEGSDVPRELRTHPRRETLLAKHPLDKVGCTTCHGGQGLQTKGVGRARFAHGRDDPYWERPLLSRPFVESTCVTCHAEEHEVPGAPLYNRGRFLFEDLGCYGCHGSRHLAPSGPAGPPLDRLRDKTSEAFVIEWLRDPRRFRPGTRMPDFWPDAGDLREREPVAIAAFLGRASAPSAAGRAAAPGSPPHGEGRALFDAIGCRGCHTLGEGASGASPLEARFGPALDGIGAMASRGWMAAWIRKPRAIWPDARMPDLRLTDDEVTELTDFLVSLRPAGVAPMQPAWADHDPALVAAGREAVLKYGCAGCHRIPGVEAPERPGPDLDDFGDLPPERLEWGDADARCDRPERECWTIAKVRSPRSLRGRGVEPVMPRFDLSDDDVLALSVFLLANRRQPAVPRALDERAKAVAEGERVIARHNCRGCHEMGRAGEGARHGVAIDPRGGDIRRFYPDPALAPPALAFAGRKFQYAWLYDFLRRPRKVRPWLTARMPAFDLDAREAEAIVRAFAASDGRPFPFDPGATVALDPIERADARALLGKLQCARCHVVTAGEKVAAAERAPDLTLAAGRLKPAWMRDWLLEPQALVPGTRMPSYFPLGDEDDPSSRITPYPALLGGEVGRQIDALVSLTVEMARAEAPRPGTIGGIP